MNDVRVPNSAGTKVSATMAALLEAVEADRTINPRRRRETASAIRSLGKHLGQPLQLVPTAPEALRRHLVTLNPASRGIGKARLANILSLVNRTLVLAGVKPNNRTLLEVATPAWSAVIARLEDRYLRSSLGPFVRWCCIEGIEPDAVDDPASERYRAYLRKTALVKKPDTVHQTVCRAWNAASDRLPGWPPVRLTVPRYAETCTLPLEQFPPCFVADLEAYLAHISSSEACDLFDQDAPGRPLRPGSIKTKRYQVRQFASALVIKGVPIGEITSLGVLTTPENLKLALSCLLSRPRVDMENTRSAGGVAHTIRAIARHWVRLPEAEMTFFDRVTAKLNRRESGMTDKNRHRLAQFDDPKILARFLRLPLTETERLRRKGIRTRIAAVEFANLVALEILIHVPLRISNLSSLELGKTFIMPACAGHGEARIAIPRRRVKNRELLHYALPEDSTGLVAYYIAKVKPLLESKPTPFLFPNKTGRAKRSDTHSKQLSRLVAGRLGIAFHPHLVRHLVAKLVVEHQPGNYEGARRLLGHRSQETTYSAYEGMETRSATRFHAELVRSKRGYVPRLDPAGRGGARKRPSKKPGDGR